jgi:hypothetical protein
MDPEEGQGWSREYVNQMAIEYKRFLTLSVKYSEETIAPSKDVDKFWHGHILDTMKYAEDCQNVFGYFLHHFPYFGMRGEEDAANLAEAGRTTKRLYEEEFAETISSRASMCSVTVTKGDVAMCSVAIQSRPSMCSVAVTKGDVAMCSVAIQSRPAMCSVAVTKGDVAMCSVAIQSKPAMCSVAVTKDDVAMCSVAIQSKPAMCSVAVTKDDVAMCSVAIQSRPAMCSVAVTKGDVAMCSVAIQSKPAMCSVAVTRNDIAMCAVANQEDSVTSLPGARKSDSRNILNTSVRPRLALAA